MPSTRPRARARLKASIALAALALAACGTPETPPSPERPCPRIAVLENTGRLSRFGGAAGDPSNLVFEAEIVNTLGTCGYREDAVHVDMRVQIVAFRGAAGRDDPATFNYLVAIARSDRTILAREAFDVELDLPADQSEAAIVEEIEQTIPLREGESGADYVILVGFELTPDELEYNRQQGR